MSKYDDLDYASVKAMHDELAAILARKRPEAIESLKAQMAALGVTPEDMVPKKNGKRGPVAAKYRNPENPAEVWSGRGKAPKWMQAHLDAGNDKEELAIS